MTIPVSLKAVAQELDLINNEVHAFLNKATGELVVVSNEEFGAVEREDDINKYPDWQRELIQKAQEILETDDYLPLPSEDEIDDYDIMERFCLSIENEKLSAYLLDQIRGKGAFRRFENAIDRQGIAEDWYKFRQAELEGIAAAWLEENSIPYIR